MSEKPRLPQFTFDWKLVSGRERGETPTLACPSCGSEHDERARRKLLRRAKWRPTAEPVAENRISFHASRLDSARKTLASVTEDFRGYRLAATNGEPAGLAPFFNLVLGEPHETAGAIELDRMMQLRTGKELPDAEQSTVGVDVQQDRVYVVKMAFTPDDERMRVQDYAELGGAPDDPATWDSVLERIASAPGPPPTCMIDASCYALAARHFRRTSRAPQAFPRLRAV